MFPSWNPSGTYIASNGSFEHSISVEALSIVPNRMRVFYLVQKNAISRKEEKHPWSREEKINKFKGYYSNETFNQRAKGVLLQRKWTSTTNLEWHPCLPKKHIKQRQRLSILQSNEKHDKRGKAGTKWRVCHLLLAD
jgi:hypothetical protein